MGIFGYTLNDFKKEGMKVLAKIRNLQSSQNVPLKETATVNIPNSLVYEIEKLINNCRHKLIPKLSESDKKLAEELIKILTDWIQNRKSSRIQVGRYQKILETL